MIILRQRNYSTPGAKLIYAKNRLANKVVSVLPKSVKSKFPNLHEKTKLELLKQSVIEKNKAKDKLLKPGELIDDAISFTTSSPLAAAGTTLGLRYLPGLPGTTETSIAIDAAAKRVVPGYGKATKYISDKYKQGKVSRGIRKLQYSDKARTRLKKGLDKVL